MRVEKKVPLSRQYTVHGRVFDEITLLEPLGADLDTIGEIEEVQPFGDRPVRIIHEDRINAYRDRLIKKGDDLPGAGDITVLCLADSLLVRSAVRSFFTEAWGVVSASRKISSSSDGDGSQLSSSN